MLKLKACPKILKLKFAQNVAQKAELKNVGQNAEIKSCPRCLNYKLPKNDPKHFSPNSPPTRTTKHQLC